MWIKWVSCINLLVLIQSLVGTAEDEDTSKMPDRLDFIKEPQNTIVLSLVDEVLLECEASSPNGNITYKWIKKENDGNVREVQEKDEIEFRNGSLVFKAPSLLNEHTGLYQCLVNNSEGLLLSREARLTYAYFFPPRSIHALSPVVALVDSSVRLRCGIEDASIPYHVEYTWWKEVNLTGTPEYITLKSSSTDIFNSLDGYLYFSQVKRSHAGKYKCSAKFREIKGNGVYVGDPNKNTQMSHEKLIRVLDPDSQLPPFGIFQNFPRVFPIQPKLKQTVDMECVAFGQLPIEYRWQYNDEDIVNNTQFENRLNFSENNRRMKVSDIKLVDEGNYTCIAISGENKTSSYFTMDAEGMPVFSLKPSDGIVHSNKFLKLNCLVYAPLQPEVHWLKNGLKLENKTDQIYVDSESLILFRPTKGRDDGLYQCSAKNVFGTVYSSAKVTVVVVDNKPTSGTYDIRSKTFIVLIFVMGCLLNLY